MGKPTRASICLDCEARIEASPRGALPQRCKPCKQVREAAAARRRARSWYEANSQSVLSRLRAARSADPDAYRAHQRAYYRANPERWIKRAALLPTHASRHRHFGCEGVPELIDKRSVFEVDGYVCQGCKAQLDPKAPHALPDGALNPLYPQLDHIVPLSAGLVGHVRSNVQTLCARCNWSKGARILERA